jgi:hypothetical protein
MVWKPESFADPENVLNNGGPDDAITKAWFQLVPKSDNGKATLQYVAEGISGTPCPWGIRIVTPRLQGFTVPTRHGWARELMRLRVPEEYATDFGSYNWGDCDWARFE